MLGFHIRKSHILFKFLGKSKPKTTGGGEKTTRQTFVCTDCDFETSTSETLFEHVRQRHRKSDSDSVLNFSDSDRQNLSKMFECNMCEYSSSKAFNLHRHYNRVHLDAAETFSCDRCPEEFGDRQSLENHRHKHDEPTKKKSSSAASASAGGSRLVDTGVLRALEVHWVILAYVLGQGGHISTYLGKV